MKTLLYCIHLNSEQSPADSIRQIEELAVRLVPVGRLQAVISSVKHIPIKSDLQAVLTYEKVIRFFHANRTVVPFQFGSLFESDAGLLQWLTKKEDYFFQLLNKIKDCDEIEVRILFQSNSLIGTTVSRDNPSRVVLHNAPTESGQKYLARQKEYYDWQDQYCAQIELVKKVLCTSLRDFFVEVKHEYALRNNVSVCSLYFLVPRSWVHQFQQEVKKILLPSSPKLLLSGPCPPYNFVCEDSDITKIINSEKHFLSYV